MNYIFKVDRGICKLNKVVFVKSSFLYLFIFLCCMVGIGGYYMVGVIGWLFSLYEYYFIVDCVYIYYWKLNLYCGIK